mmetsp:Transcript_19953/g.17684  ORF Transcript_19953/g.17684 Transcript_19953/m.17684 type:complete len:229 (-) Transcript_19953:1319-2005(-)
MSSLNSEQLEVFLNKLLPECMNECNDYTKTLITKGHKELEPHLLNKCENVSKEDLLKDMETAMTKLQTRINDKFLVKYQEFVRNFILIYKDDPCVIKNIIEPSKDKYQSYDENLANEKNELYKQYIEKQKILKQLNDETIQLQNEFDNTLKSINDNYQAMKSEAAQQHQILLNQLQQKFDIHQTDNMDNNLQSNSDNNQNESSHKLSAADELRCSYWDSCETSAILPL